jgi:hypothetical protein
MDRISISHASQEASNFTNDLVKFGHQIGTELTKTSALDLSEAHPVGQALGIS